MAALSPSLQNEDELKLKLKEVEDRKFQIKAGIFLTGVTFISAAVGFGATVAAVKKAEPEPFKQGAVAAKGAEPGVFLALRALGWGSLYAWSGCGILFYGIWKLSGATNFEEFRMKMGSILPKLPKSENPGRSEFEDFYEFLDYMNLTSKTKSK